MLLSPWKAEKQRESAEIARHRQLLNLNPRGGAAPQGSSCCSSQQAMKRNLERKEIKELKDERKEIKELKTKRKEVRERQSGASAAAAASKEANERNRKKQLSTSTALEC